MGATVRERAPRRRRRSKERPVHAPVKGHARLLSLSEDCGWEYLGQRGREISFQRADPRSVIGSTKLCIEVDDQGLVIRAWHIGLQVPAAEGELAHAAALKWLSEPVDSEVAP